MHPERYSFVTTLSCSGLVLALVSKLSTATRRLVLGRPFRSDKLSHTLLPKRIALPVFASDALVVGGLRTGGDLPGAVGGRV